MGKTCAVVGCRTHPGDVVSYHVFPKDPEVLEQWIQFCGNAKLVNVSKKRNGLLYRHVCSKHFDKSVFRNPMQFSLGLKRNAVPTIQVDAEGEEEHILPTGFVADDDKDDDILDEQFEMEEEFLIDALDNDCGTPEYLDSNDEDRESSQTENIENLSAAQERRIQNDHKDAAVYYRGLYEAEISKVENLKKQLSDVRKQRRESQRLSNRRKQALNEKIQIIRSLKRQLKEKHKLEAEDKQLVDAVKANPVLQESIKNSAKNKYARRYRATRLLATRQKLSSTASYKKFRGAQVLCMPHPKTVTRWQRKVKLAPGFNREILRRMSIAAKNMTEKEKTVAVLIDGMAIKAMVDYHAESDRLHGFPDDGSPRVLNDDDPLNLATEAVTIMVRSIHTNYKQVIGYFLTSGTLGSERQKDIVCEAIRLLEKCGFHPVVLVMDQHPTNVKMVEALGASQEVPMFKVDSTEIVVLYDNPHLFKSVRNNLFTKNLLFEGEIASFKHIRNLYNKEKNKTIRLAKGLTPKSVNLPVFSKMSVRTATRTLSRTTAKAIETHVKLGSMPQQALSTAKLILIMDTLFDVFNSRFKVDAVKPLRAAITEASEHWKFLEETKHILENMQFVPADCFDPETASDEAHERLTSTQRIPPCISGYIQNINAIRLLWTILHEQRGFSILRTINLCQDPLENEFGKLRRACGTNDVPNAHQFAAAIKYSCIEKTLRSDYNSNCIPDDTINLLDEQIVDEEEVDTDPLQINGESFLMRPFEPLDHDREDLLPDLIETNALVYIVGYVVSKLSHEKCKNGLKIAYSSDVNYTFCRYKQYLNAAGFIYPNTKALEIGAVLLIAFKQKFYKFLRECRSGIKTRLKEYVHYTDVKEEICCICFHRFVDCFLNTLFNGQVTKMQSTNFRRQRATGLKRNGKARRMDLPIQIKTTKKRTFQNIKSRISRDSNNLTSSRVAKRSPIVKQKNRQAAQTSQTPSTRKRNRASSQFCVEANDEVLPTKMSRHNDIEKAGPSGKGDRPLMATSINVIDPEIAKMQKVTEQLEKFVASIPKRRIVRVEQRDCFHLTMENIFNTYAEYQDELTQIFDRYSKYNDRQLKTVDELVNWDEVCTVFTQDQQYAMSIFLDEKLVPKDLKGQFTEFIDTILTFEWGLRIFKKIYNFANMSDALLHIKQQEDMATYGIDSEDE